MPVLWRRYTSSSGAVGGLTLPRLHARSLVVMGVHRRHLNCAGSTDRINLAEE